MSGPGFSKNWPPKTLRLWLSAIDPGQIRLLTAGRAALALLSIWLVMRTAVIVLLGRANPTLPLFGVLAGMVLLLFIIDLKPSDRKLSLWLATIPFAGGIVLASTLADNFWLNNLILLLLFFLAYFFRRYGARAGELALVTTVGYYFGFLLDPPPVVYPLLLACVFASALIVYLWQFLILPYDPVKYLYHSVRAFYHNVAQGVAAIRRGLDSGSGQTLNTRILQRHFRQVNWNRRVIEGLFSAAASPALWSQPRLSQLQEELFKTERGLELLIEATGVLSSQLDELPKDVLQSLKEGLAVLEDQLWEMASGEEQTRLSEAGESLQKQVKSSLEEKPPGEWVFSILRMGIAARQLARSVADIHTLEIAWEKGATDRPSTIHSEIAPTQVFNSPRKKKSLTLHPTTILGLQAVLAAGLAMLAACLLKMDSPNLVFWTAFVVVAGSTGESLRRITMRVIGVIAGTVIGVALAVILPDNLPVVVILVTMCLFMSIYVLTISYIWMVFWLNIGMLLVITTLGGAALELLVVRPVSTLVGGAMAALVVSFVLPIHVQDRFTATLAGFLAGVDRYIDVYARTLTDTLAIVDLRAEELNIDASYKKLELNLPNVIYEYNPLSRAQNRLATQATSLAVLKSYVTNLNDDVGGDPGSLANAQDNELISYIQLEIHQAIEALNGFLADRQGEKLQLSEDTDRRAKMETILQEFLTADVGSTDAIRNRALYHLKRIYDTILQIASGLGAPLASTKHDLGA